MEIILASSSPRRKELLKRMGYDFTVDVSEVDETCALIPKEAVKELASRKARAVASRHDKGLIIASDTLVSLDDTALGKPIDKNDAYKMLRALSGRTHAVYSGVCMIDTATGREISEVAGSFVTFRDVSDEEINKYIATGEPMDKAGAYAIQGGAGAFVEKLEGSFENVMGFPVDLVKKMLSQFE